MRIYSVHRRSRGVLEEPQLRAVKEGFCWPGLFFGPLWAAWRGDWVVAAGILAIFAAAVLPGAPWLSLPLLLLAAFVAGFEGNDLARWSLRRRGFAETGLVAGRNAADAEARFLARAAP